MLHTYAGLIAFYLAQPSDDISEETTFGSSIKYCNISRDLCSMADRLNGHGAAYTGHGWDTNLLRDAQAHLERARAIDPSNLVAEAFLSQVILCSHYSFLTWTCDAHVGLVSSFPVDHNPRGIAKPLTRMTRRWTLTGRRRLASASERELVRTRSL